MRDRTDEIFALLPAWLRRRDAEEGQAVKARVAPGDPRAPEEFGPLRTLASLVAREAQIVGEGIDRHYDDAFIETCAPWVIPYLGDLLGVRGLQDIPEGIDMRARVADALALRARKGTLRALEHAAATSSGWPVRAVEYWRKLVHAQSMRLVHPDLGASVDFRDKPALARIGTAFERQARGVEVRRIDTAGGRWMLGNVGLHVWRLIPFSITEHRVFEVAGGRRDFRFHPLGCDAPLFDVLGLRGDIDTPAAEDRMPVAIDRRIMVEDVARFYGPGRAMEVRVGSATIPPERVTAAHLGDLPGGGAEPDWNHAAPADGVLIDPELGRLKVGADLTGPVRVTCHFARPLDIGGGEHGRAAAIGSVEDGVVLPPTGASVSTRIADAGGAGTFLLDQSTRYAAGGTVSVPVGALLRLVATDGHAPTLRLTAPLVIRLGAGASVELNGIRVFNDLVRIEGGDPAEDSAVTVTDCTLVPGRALDRTGAPLLPGATALEVAVPGASVAMRRSVSGPVRLDTDIDARFTECILDAGGGSDAALFAAPGAARHVVALDRCTVRGRVETDAFADGARTSPEGFGVARDSTERLASSDTLFVADAVPAVAAARRQVGCLRFCHVPPGSLTPRRYRCTDGPPPVFASLRPADPDYMLLHRRTADTIRRGAENGGEIGVYNRAAHGARADNIRRSVDDFLRFGHAAGIFHET